MPLPTVFSLMLLPTAERFSPMPFMEKRREAADDNLDRIDPDV